MTGAKFDWRDTGIILLLAFVAAGLGTASLTQGHDWGGDFAQYVHQAKSMVDQRVGEFLAENRKMMGESSRAPGPVAYPWGWPFLLSLIYRVRGVDWLAMKGLVVGFHTVTILVIYLGLTKTLGRGGAFLIGLGLSVNPFLVSFLNQVMADIPFAFFSSLALLMIWAHEREPSGRPLPFCQGIVLGCLIGFALLFRSNGILLLMCLALVQLRRVFLPERLGAGTRWDWAGTLRRTLAWPVSMALILPYVVAFSLVGMVGWVYPEGGASHVDRLSSISLVTLSRNIQYYGSLLLVIFEGVPGRHAWFLLMMVFAILGGCFRIRTSLSVVSYVGLTYVLYMVWPGSFQGMRHLLPVLPFVAYLALAGFQEAVTRLPGTLQSMMIWGGRGIGIYLVAWMGTISMSNAIANLEARRSAPEGPFTSEAQAMFDAVLHALPSHHRVIFFKPRVFHLMTGQPAIIRRSYETVPDSAMVILYHAEDGLTWPFPATEVEAAVARGAAERIHASARFTVYLKPSRPEVESGTP
ncbi:MAG TPA: glycosyltransferase family 39 protein [Kiritimatiellia bacterium]|nr:glycosyltransferase family 39 protein [Kiritimatiellia bacterium]